MVTGIELIAKERQRQINEEGWTPEHDATHTNGEMAIAAACYAFPMITPVNWPWDAKWWKPRSYVDNLIRAGALIAAELDRINQPNLTKAD